MAEKCCNKVFGGYDYYRCGRPGKIQRDGRWYCGFCDPVKVAARRAKQYAKIEAETQVVRDAYKAALIRGKQADAFPELVAALRGLYSGIQQDGGNRPYDTAMNMAREALTLVAKIEKEQGNE